VCSPHDRAVAPVRAEASGNPRRGAAGSIDSNCFNT